MRRGVLLAGIALAACAATSAPRVQVVRSLEGRQCEGGGLTLAELQARLVAAGVKPAAAQCASDGRMRVQMCGAADGRLAVFDIEAADRDRAAAAGFRALAADEKVVVQPCR